ncbi:succinyl-diaminopimelate desuccinylase (plasmid) [Legionella adelaidensis]|uniref:Succinyl-diaminopimelate desuccinylase n=1 Tax=Legionella adelaidensis TaxID=45056 RepID=A0A0W0R4L8_9GAMM|nr:M20 family metallopeptidase [Legionella adelaidensis]KTC66016.1 succinyl-diaminopimelate desuccinylase [Legionella adelaidensis]VEH85769.1 succinyl-diaminopimelate desuccinylase [Legionella adelaidensis]
MLKPHKLLEYINAQWDEEILPTLVEYIKIPNKSPLFDPDWQKNGYMEKAVALIVNWCKSHSPKKMNLEILRLKNRTPVILIDIPGEANKEVLLYGHLDKQPEMAGWRNDLGPWKPVLENGRLYGRGGADDGYAVFSAITAINALQQQGVPHGHCKILIEASEESGSSDLPFYIEAFKEKLGTPHLIVCLDSGAGNYEQLWVTTSLRGDVAGELKVELLTEGVHSGYGSGIVADSFRVARELLSRLEEESTGHVKLQELHCQIPPDRVSEAAECAAVLGKGIIDSLPLHPGVQSIETNEQELLLNRTWRPALTVTGARGLPPISNAGNVLRPETALKFSMRLPPIVDAKEAAKVISTVLTENPPYNAKVSVTIFSASTGWDAPHTAPWLREGIHGASESFYQKPAVFMGEGGTIPFMAMLGKEFPEAQYMITGVLGPHSNAHGPNEFLHLDMAKKITACVAFVIHKQAES